MDRSSKKRKRFIKGCAIVMAIIILPFVLVVIFSDNKTLEWEQFEVNASGIDISIGEGIKIVHLSDLHFVKQKVDTDELASGVIEQKPDIIVITGDLVDSRKPDIAAAFDFVKKIQDICPIYYIYGNHEERGSSTDSKIKEQIDNLKQFKLLKNSHDTIYIRGIKIIIAGLLDDEKYRTTTFSDIAVGIGENTLKILLAHRPERFDEYTNPTNIFLPDLILSGHTHGGQIRLPVLGGILAPSNGFFPKYDGGIFYSDNNGGTGSGSAMINSRGIGSSIFPFRVNNKPHIPVVAVY